MKPNPILLEVFKNRFASISEEMGVTLTRTAFSPNIKERRDLSCVLYVIRALVPTDIPTNAGCSRPLKVITRKGSVLDAAFPAAVVAGGNVEMSQRIVDAVRIETPGGGGYGAR